MGRETKIEWTKSTLNLAWGCTKVSAGCDNCYMFRNSASFNKNPEQIVYFSIPNAKKRIAGYGDIIFVNSNTDTFHEKNTFEQIDEWFAIFKSFPHKQFQILTKRTNRMRQYFETRDCPVNCWLGTSIEDQQHVFRADTLRRIKKAKIKFISFEPIISKIESCNLEGIQWAIVGGESDDYNPRPMLKEWAEHLCFNIIKKQNVALWFKQWGGIGGSGAGGDIINGQQYHEYPLYGEALLQQTTEQQPAIANLFSFQ
jgi:protein gp37